MRSTRLPTVCASVATRCQYWWDGPQVNKFEQVSSLSRWGPGPGGSPYSKFSCPGEGARAMVRSACVVISNASCEQNDRQTRLKTLPSRNISLAGRKMFGHTCSWPDRERGSSLAEDRAPRELRRVIEWILEGHYTSDSCLGWQTQGRQQFNFLGR